MIQNNTVIRCTDNSGVKEVRCIQPLKQKGTASHTMCIFKATVTSVASTTLKKNKNETPIKKSDLVLCLLVRSKGSYGREKVRFSDNACIIINSTMKPFGTKIFGPVMLPVRDESFSSIVSIVGKKQYIFDTSKS